MNILSWTRSRLLVALPLLLAGAVLTAPPARAADPQPQVFGVHPVMQGSTTLSHGHFRYDVAAGTTIDDAVVIENFSDAPIAFTVYGADLLQAQGGGSAPAQQDATMHAVGLWIHVSQKNVKIGPHASATVLFSMVVPATADPGDHLGTLVTQANIGKSGGVAVQGRTALITEVVVPGTALPNAELSPLMIAKGSAGRDGFTILMKNTGNTLLNISGSVVIKDGSGSTVASLPIKPADGYAIPGGTIDLRTDGWQPSPGDFTAQALLTGTYSSGKKSFQSNGVKFNIVNWSRVAVTVVISLALLGGIVMGVVTLIHRTRRRRAATDERRRDAEARQAVSLRLKKL